MIFLIQYDRAQGRLVELRTFDQGERALAEHERFELELALNRTGVEREVVLLDASSEEAMRQTHRRYFETLDELAESSPVGRTSD